MIIPEVLQALDDGERVQIQVEGKWVDVSKYCTGSMSDLVANFVKYEWRIQPKGPIIIPVWLDSNPNPNPNPQNGNFIKYVLGNETQWSIMQIGSCNKRYKITIEEWPEESV
jgi:hypothetical protein